MYLLDGALRTRPSSIEEDVRLYARLDMGAKRHWRYESKRNKMCWTSSSSTSSSNECLMTSVNTAERGYD